MLRALQHQEPDRVPLYVWIFGQPGVIDDIRARYGTYEAFCDALQLDMCQAFPSKGFLKSTPPRRESELPADLQPAKRNIYGNVLTLEQALDSEFTDPSDEAIYETPRREVEHHKGQRGRAIFLQTPGVFEATNGLLGLEQTLQEMALRPELLRQLFERIAHWNIGYVRNAVAIGVDVIHISDDWGMNQQMLFSPRQWWELVYPTELITAQAAREAGAFLSLHTDGYVADVLEGVLQLGVQCLHPIQESAGMDQRAVKRQYGDRLTIYGGLDVRTTLGRGSPETVVAAVRGVMNDLQLGGGFIFCTSHMVQPGTPIEEVELAYQVALEESWY